MLHSTIVISSTIETFLTNRVIGYTDFASVGDTE